MLIQLNRKISLIGGMAIYVDNYRFNKSDKLRDSHLSKSLSVNEWLMTLRYYSKFTLQYCAVLSQLSMHDEALENAK